MAHILARANTRMGWTCEWCIYLIVSSFCNHHECSRASIVHLTTGNVETDANITQIQVDGATYTWMGEPMVNGAIPPVVNQTAFSYSSTRSVFSMDVGGLVNMTITFLSNITPNDLQRQSVPFSYLDVQVTSMDGAPHDVQVYTDISGGEHFPHLI